MLTTSTNKQRIQSEHRGLKAKTRLKTDVIKQQERLLSDQRDALAEAKGSLTAAQAEAREADARAAQVTCHYCYDSVSNATASDNVTSSTTSGASSLLFMELLLRTQCYHCSYYQSDSLLTCSMLVYS
jgi:hypothetical protein